MEVGVFEGRNRFSELVEAAERGEETIVLKRGRPVAKVVPIRASEQDQAALRRATAVEALAAAERLRTHQLQERGRPFDHEDVISARDEGRR